MLLINIIIIVHYQLLANLDLHGTLILPIIVLIAVVVLIIFISSLVSPSNKAKKYLEDNGYICNKQTCTKDSNNNIYTFNYDNLTYFVDTDFYYVNIGKEAPSLTLKDDEYVCTFTKDDYKVFTLVDNSFIYNQMCEKYVEKVNSHIKEYEKSHGEASPWDLFLENYSTTASY